MRRLQKSKIFSFHAWQYYTLGFEGDTRELWLTCEKGNVVDVFAQKQGKTVLISSQKREGTTK